MRIFLLLSVFSLINVSFALERGSVSPDFQLPSRDLSTISLAKFKGSVVLVDFWASWCAPCKKSLPWLNEMQAKYGSQGFSVIAVNLDADRADGEKMLSNSTLFKVAFDPDGKTPEKFGVSAMPSSYLIDRNGTITEIFRGFEESDKEIIEKRIRSLLSNGALQ